MRTNIVIDDKLMAQAMKAGGFKTKRDAVEAGLSKLVSANRYQRMIELYGKVEWVGDLEQMRLNQPRYVAMEAPAAPYKRQATKTAKSRSVAKKAARA